MDGLISKRNYVIMVGNKLVLIMGCPRSGTSAVAGMLHTGGISMGTDMIEPSEYNEKGYYEDKNAVRMNRYAFGAVGVKATHYNPDQLKEGYRRLALEAEYHRLHKVSNRRIIGLISSMSKYCFDRSDNNNWGIKDPLMCYVLPLWITSLRTHSRELFAINPTRDEESFVKSVENLLREEWHGRWVDQIRAARKLYHKTTIDECNKYDIPLLTVKFENLLADPVSTQKELEQFLNVELGEAYTFIDPELNHNSEGVMPYA